MTANEAANTSGPQPRGEGLQETAASSTERSGKRMLAKLVISLLLGGGFAWLVTSGGVPLIPSGEALRSVSIPALILHIVLVLLYHTIRALRWRHLIAPIKRMKTTEVLVLNWVGFFAIFLLPLRLGEFVRPAIARVKYGISASSALGTVLVERVLDGLVTSCLIMWALVSLPRIDSGDFLAEHLPTYAYLATTMFLAGFAFLVLYFFKRQLITKLLVLTLGRVLPQFAGKLADLAGRAAEGLTVFSQPRLAFGFLAETGLYWALNIVAAFVLARACALELSLAHMVAVSTVIALGILLPTGPGLFGSFQLAVSTGLKLYLPLAVVQHEGSAFIFLMYTVQLGVIVVTGLAALALLRSSQGPTVPLSVTQLEEVAVAKTPASSQASSAQAGRS